MRVLRQWFKRRGVHWTTEPRKGTGGRAGHTREGSQDGFRLIPKPVHPILPVAQPNPSSGFCRCLPLPGWNPSAPRVLEEGGVVLLAPQGLYFFSLPKKKAAMDKNVKVGTGKGGRERGSGREREREGGNERARTVERVRARARENGARREITSSAIMSTRPNEERRAGRKRKRGRKQGGRQRSARKGGRYVDR